MNNILEEKLKNLPSVPGIYQFKDKTGKVIYVGKAKNLRSRVRSYFQKNLNSPKTEIMISKAADLELIITDSEFEALVLENNFIKDLKPRYNILLKDDKTFPYIRITKEPYPQIFPTRQVIRDGSKYFGPFTDVKSMKNSLSMINRIFKIRSCKFYIDEQTIEKKKIKVCLDYHIKKCDGPCEGLISQINYNEMVSQVEKLLKGKTAELIKELNDQMSKASENFNFENAAILRDKIKQLEVYSSRQKIVTNDFEDKDILSLASEGKDVACTILNIRSGRLVGKKQLKLINENLENEPQIYTSAIKFYYNEYVEIPHEIVVDTDPAEMDFLAEWLSSKAGFKVKFVVPQRKSDIKSLLFMCKQNAILQLKEIQLQRMKREGNVPFVLAALKRDLRLKNVPKIIECFDISNLQGTDTVASMVVFLDGKPKKSLYRKFIIKEVNGPDDFASMQEVIERRYSRMIEEKENPPDLIMVDGGKGQLSSAVEILNKIGLTNYEIIGLAKRLEEIFLPGNSEAVIIPKTSSALKLLQQVRDEAHRFAITFHRQRRSKRTITTELFEIKGIGKKTAEKLLREFKSIEDIKNADPVTLSKIIGIGNAKKVYVYFSENK